MEVADRVVVVTGGGSGIGAALCRRFAAENAAAVVVSDINEAGPRAVAGEIGGSAVRTDVTVESDVQALVSSTIEEHGRIDIFCSNAGVGLGAVPSHPIPGGSRASRCT